MVTKQHRQAQICHGPRTTDHGQIRHGFTITEMMVSVAVIMLIMAIVAEAFVAGMESFRQFKAIGDLDQRLRAASILLRRDLQADHFNAPPARLSSYSAPPAQGYFYISSTGTSTEGADADNVDSRKPNAANHMLVFTVNWSKGSGSTEDPHLMRLENYLSAPAPAGLANRSPAQFSDGVNFLSQAAEVAYFLTPTTASTTGTSPQPLYKLHRRQRLLLTPSDAAVMNGTGGNLADFNHIAVLDEAGSLHFHTLEDVADPAERTLAPAPTPLTGNDIATDVILYDVLSFTIRVFPDNGTATDFVDVTAYDTGSTPPPAFNIKAIQITLRVWDVKTNTTRQITIVQDM